MNDNCYLCGQKILKKDESLVDISIEGLERVHHKHCSKFYNRLKSIYGDRFSDLGLDRVKLNSSSSTKDLIEIFLHDIRNSRYPESGLVNDLNEFKRLYVNECFRANAEIIIIISNISIFNEFLNSLNLLLDHFTINNDLKVRILLIEDSKVDEFLQSFPSRGTSSHEINFLSPGSNSYFLSVIDNSTIFFAEPQYDQHARSVIKPKYYTTISSEAPITWHGIATFETFWKQSILEAKIRDLSNKLKNNEVPNHNIVGILAHELKNPIQPILGFSDMIQNNTRLDTDQKNDLLKIISRNARKLDIMTNNILDYARMENNSFDLKYEYFDVIKVLEELISDYGIQINKKRIKINLTYTSSPIQIHADKMRLIEVLDNLMNNAVKFTEDGKIDVTVEKFSESIKISVKDTGCGIKPNNMNRMFSKFFTTDKLGTGLGLYISKIIVQKHEGKIIGLNNELGPGSIFVVELPI